MSFRALDSDNPNPPPKKEEDEEDGERPEMVSVHCDYGGCDAVVSDYGQGRKEVSCEKGTKCKKFVMCPFTF